MFVDHIKLILLTLLELWRMPKYSKAYTIECIRRTYDWSVTPQVHDVCRWRAYVTNVCPQRMPLAYVNVNVTDTISWRGHHDRVMQLNWLYFCGICQMMPVKMWPNTALGCNYQSICMPQLQPSCSAALVPNVLPWRDEGSGKPCTVIEAL